MPLYEYECPKCGIFEELQNINENKLKKCPKCRSKITSLIGKVGPPQFKGSGFYSTDYKNTKPED